MQIKMLERPDHIAVLVPNADFEHQLLEAVRVQLIQLFRHATAQLEEAYPVFLISLVKEFLLFWVVGSTPPPPRVWRCL